MTNEQRAKALTTEALKMTNNEEIKQVILNELATRQEVIIMIYEIIYSNEVIDTATDTYEACELVKEYRIALKSNNVWYRRGE